MLNVKFAPPSIFGIDWKNPEQIREYQQSQNIALQAAFGQIGSRANNPNYIVVEGESIQDLPEIRSEADVLEAIGLKDLTVDEVDQVEKIGSTTMSAAQWAYLGLMDQGVATTDTPSFTGVGVGEGGMTVAGDIDVTSITIGSDVVDTNEWAFLNGLDQSVSQGASPTFVNVTATSFVIGGNTLDTGEWAYLDGQDQGVKQTDSPTFVTVTATAFDIGGNSLTTTEWAYLDGLDQALKQADNVTFAQITGSSFVIGGNTLDTSEWAFLDGLDQAVDTAATVTFGSITIGGNTLDTSEWAFLDGLDQSVDTTATVTFSSITIGGNTVDTNEWAYLDGLNQSVASGASVSFGAVTLTSIVTGGATLSSTELAYLDNLDQSIDSNAAPSWTGLTIYGNITITGTVDGVDVSAIPTTYMPLAGGTFTGDVLFQNAEQARFRDSGIHIASATANHLDLTATSIDMNGAVVCTSLLTSASGRVVNTTRITGNATLDATHHKVFADTDGGAFTVTLPAGVDGTEYRIINVGVSGKDVTVAPDGAELLLGVNSNLTMSDGDVLAIVYETTEGWY